MALDRQARQAKAQRREHGGLLKADDLDPRRAKLLLLRLHGRPGRRGRGCAGRQVLVVDGRVYALSTTGRLHSFGL